MYALTVTSRKQLERATLRAQAAKLKMEEVVFGIYKVWGSTGNLYLVGIEPANDGGYDVCCTCPTQNTFCKHVSTVMPHYLMREKEMLTEEDTRAANQAAPAHLLPVEGSWPVQEIEEFIAESNALPDQDEEEDPTRCACGKPGFSLVQGYWLCINCIRDLAAKQVITCKDCQAPATGSEGRCIECQCAKDSADLFGTPTTILSFTRRERVKEAW